METKNVIFNDPLYGWITLTPQEIAIVNSEIFQRLRYVRQLTLVHKVFTGANHTRFEHCLGVFHVAGKYAQHLYPGDDERIETIKLAALLHDSNITFNITTNI
jgi:HD superfamily phosphohydrolase